MLVNRLKAYTVIFLFDKDYKKVLLLKRGDKDGDESTMNGLITGVGGKIDLHKNEATDIKASVLRELNEETGILENEISDIKLPLATFQMTSNPELTAIIYWFTAISKNGLEGYECDEGELIPFNVSEISELAKQGRMTDAKYALPWILERKAYLSEETHTAVIDKKRKKMLIAGENPSIS